MVILCKHSTLTTNGMNPISSFCSVLLSSSHSQQKEPTSAWYPSWICHSTRTSDKTWCERTSSYKRCFGGVSSVLQLESKKLPSGLSRPRDGFDVYFLQCYNNRTRECDVR